jgi:IclR family acetate operon transcriptional repressor
MAESHSTNNRIADERAASARRRGRPAAAASSRDAAGAVQSLDRALNLLEEVSRHEQGVTLTDLAQSTGLAPSTAHRLLRTLESRDYLRQDEQRGLWFVGVRAFTVGSAFVRMRDIVAIARPLMRQLVDDVGESANLAVLDNGQPVYLSQIECRQMIRAHALPGARAMPHCSGVGKALLSFLPAERARTILRETGMPALTDKTITTIRDYMAALETVRAQGYAVDDEEQSPGMRCVAAVIHDEYGDPVAAVSVTGPSARIDDRRIALLGARVKAAAAAITEAIGGRS